MANKWLSADLKAIQDRYQVGQLAASLIANRHLDEKQIEELMHPGSLKISEAPCVRDACERIFDAKEMGEKVFVAGDYDADGVMATTIMKYTLDQLGIENGYYIPDRVKDGYGLNVKMVEMAVERGYSLLITVDNGVHAHEALQRADELGIDVIVTDHHTMDEKVLAEWIVHPSMMEEDYMYCSGASVALQLSMRLIGIQPYLVSLAMIAAIGDVMEVWKQTRVIIREGLRYLNEQHFAPIMALVGDRDIDEETISFYVVPKINAVSRLCDRGNVNNLVRFFLATDPLSVQHFASQLEELNEERKALSSRMVIKAGRMVDDHPVQVIFDESFHEGIVGLAAGHLARDLNQPVLVLTRSEGLIKGSGRSIDGFDLYAFMNECFEDYAAFGGHPGAVGLSVREKDFELFKASVYEKAEQIDFSSCVSETEVYEVDSLRLKDVLELDRFRPFGHGFAKPVFGLRDCRIIRSQLLKGRYPKYVFDKDGVFEGIDFSGHIRSDVRHGRKVAGELTINEFRGAQSIQMRLLELEDE